jgi:hypothetical protein
VSPANAMSDASAKGWRPEFTTKLMKLKHHKPYNADRLQAITDGLLQLGYLPWGSKSESVGYVSFHDEAEPGSPNLGNLNTHRALRHRCHGRQLGGAGAQGRGQAQAQAKVSRWTLPRAAMRSGGAFCLSGTA